jgi:hypothetical protein
MSFSNISPMACPAHQQVRQQLAIASSCSLASRPQCFPNSWEPDRSGPVHEHVQFPVLNRAYIFLTPPNQPVSLVYRSVFFVVGTGVGVVWDPLAPPCKMHADHLLACRPGFCTRRVNRSILTRSERARKN